MPHNSTEHTPHRIMMETYTWNRRRKGRGNTLAFIGDGLCVAASCVQPGGLGLFTTKAFMEHDIVTEYTGSVIARAQAEQENRENSLRAGHFIGLGREFVLAGDTEPEHGKGGAQFAQCAPPGVCTAVVYKCAAETVPASFKCVLGGSFRSPVRVFLRATRAIPEGTEITWSYPYKIYHYSRLYHELEQHLAPTHRRRANDACGH